MNKKIDSRKLLTRYTPTNRICNKNLYKYYCIFKSDDEQESYKLISHSPKKVPHFKTSGRNQPKLDHQITDWYFDFLETWSVDQGSPQSINFMKRCKGVKILRVQEYRMNQKSKRELVRELSHQPKLRFLDLIPTIGQDEIPSKQFGNFLKNSKSLEVLCL